MGTYEQLIRSICKVENREVYAVHRTQRLISQFGTSKISIPLP